MHLRSTGEQIPGKSYKILTFYKTQGNTTKYCTENICRLLYPNYIYSRLENNKFFSSIAFISVFQVDHFFKKINKGFFSCKGSSPGSELHTLGLYLKSCDSSVSNFLFSNMFPTKIIVIFNLTYALHINFVILSERKTGKKNLHGTFIPKSTAIQ